MIRKEIDIHGRSNMTTHRSVHLVGTASLAVGVTLALLRTVGLAQPATAGNTGPAGCQDSAPRAIRPNGLFHDGGPLYVRPSEPDAFSQVTLSGLWAWKEAE
jgi:hypothetical protein